MKSYKFNINYKKIKYLVALFSIVALASCGAKPSTDTNTNTGSNSTWTQTETATTSTNSVLKEELEVMTGEVMSGNTDESKVTKIDMSYKNPKGETMEVFVNYTLDSEGKIASINFEGYSHNGFSEKASKELLGKTLEEANNLYVSGASLATEAFKKAIKNA